MPISGNYMIKTNTQSRSEIEALIKTLQAQLADLVRQLEAIPTNRLKVWETANSFIGLDASPNDVAPDELGCAETVNEIVKKALGYPAGGTVSTNQMYKALAKSTKFIKVDQALPGDIIISPTGYGTGGLPNGHVGIFDTPELIMSNSSKTGTFEKNYTLTEWVKRYRNKGGYPIYFFRAI